MNKKVFICSFCKRQQTEVKKLIVGPDVYICDFCTNICAEILHEEDVIQEKNHPILSFTLTPEEIFKKLDEVVAGQTEAKKELSVAAYLHYLRMTEDINNNNNDIQKKILNGDYINNSTGISGTTTNTKLKKYNMLMMGPTGSGKTLLMETLSKILNVAYIIIDANTLTETGYVGEDVESIVTKLFNSVYDGNNVQEAIRKTKYGFIFIDEIDKKYSSDGATSNRDVSGKGVQQNLLKLIEGTEVQINNKKNSHQEPIIINTSSIFVIGAGAFQGLENIIKQSTKHLFHLGFNFNKNDKNNTINENNINLELVNQISQNQKNEKKEENIINFNNSSKNKDENKESIMKFFKKEHLITYGMIPELIGRFECVTILYPLNENQLIEILRDKKDNLMEEYKRIFFLHNVNLIYDDSLLIAIVKKAIEENVGARGLRSIVHKLFSEVIFTMPTICKNNANKKKYILNIKKEHVEDNSSLRIQPEDIIHEDITLSACVK
jgi:ATP-dependent Clp protease ATP-binding subunit ClpX